MSDLSFFEDLPVIGKMPPEEAASRLREVGEDEVAIFLEGGKSRKNLHTFEFMDLFKKPRLWQHTAHAFGYIDTNESGREELEPMSISHVGNIEADERLKKGRIKITLDGLRVADYPGSGVHQVLFDFYGQNQLKSEEVEHLHFNSTYRIQEGEQAAIIGYPIFIGLNVGLEGVSFRCYTVNVKNEDDEKMLSFMESDVFKAGLRLVNTAQPAIAPLSGMAVALTKTLAKRNKNIPVQEFFLGLDFNRNAMGARLREGNYLSVQIPESLERVWDWDDWAYDPSNGRIVRKDDPIKIIPYNYVAFGVAKYES